MQVETFENEEKNKIYNHQVNQTNVENDAKH